MGDLRQAFPFLDLRAVRPTDLGRDLLSAMAVTVMGVPQCVAYAMIAGLPPVMGLYAACVPAIVGAFMRSSRHVISGPTNALSLLVGGAVAAHAGLEPTEIALCLALLVGVIQVAAGLLRLGVLVDYISGPVVLGYITGAGVLIAIGQLPNLTGTNGDSGSAPLAQIEAWIDGLGGFSPLALGISLGAAAVIVILRRIDRRIPAAVIMLAIAVGLSWALDLGDTGIRRVHDLAPIPLGLPPVTVPDLGYWRALLPAAVAVTVLSLVESSAVARSISARTGQGISASTEFLGQGLANVSAAFTGAYPVSGSLSRSAINEQSGARTRLAGALSGILMLLVVVFLGPLVDLAPVAALAGLLLVAAIDLVDLARIRAVLASRTSDAVAFLATLVGTWTVSLDLAIYLGVCISLILFLRRARLLSSSHIVADERGALKASDTGEGACPRIRIVQVEGNLFFGAASELTRLLDEFVEDTAATILILRIKRAHNLDYTAATVLKSAQNRLAEEGRDMFLVGVRSETLAVLERTGVADVFGDRRLFPAGAHWFEGLDSAIREALDTVGAHECGEHCPLAHHLDAGLS